MAAGAKTIPGLAVQAGTVPLMVEVGAAAERGGLPSVWSCEFYDRSAVVTLAALAATTSRIRLGSSVAWAFGRTPITTATEFRSLAELAPGRVTLGLGTGNPQVLSDWHGLEEKHPASRLAELVGVIRDIWSVDAQPVHHEGKFYRCVLPADPTLPALGAATPRILVAAGGLPMIRAAGAVADGLIGLPLSSREFVGEIVRPALAEGARRVGREEALPITGMVLCATAETTAKARQIAASQVAIYSIRRSAEPLIRFLGLEAEVAVIREAAQRSDYAAMAAAVPDKLLDAVAAYGTGAEVVERFREGFDGIYEEPLLYFIGKGLPAETFRDSLLAACEAFA